jgi:hypothetical protein
MNPYELLKNDHEKVSDLFKRIESASGQAKLAGFKKLKAELEVLNLKPETRNSKLFSSLVTRHY